VAPDPLIPTPLTRKSKLLMLCFRTMKVAIQGLEGCFHHEAAEKLLAGQKEVFELLECSTFPEVFEAVHSGVADFGVTAVENNIFGSINPVYGLLEKHELWIAGDVSLHINQYLIGHAPISLEELKKGPVEVLSQVMAIAQCDQWLAKNLPQAVRREMNDTTASVDWVVDKKDPHYVAIAGEKAAQARGGHVIAGPINDDPNNFTRFFLLQKEHKEGEKAERTSIILRTDHTPGSLYRALGAFEENNISLSKLDSHPIPGDKRHYAFYIDFDTPLSSKAAQNALAKLKGQSCVVKILGSYPVTT
jgi:prephenate dehydratase